jgi:hypothetical protein
MTSVMAVDTDALRWFQQVADGTTMTEHVALDRMALLPGAEIVSDLAAIAGSQQLVERGVVRSRYVC